MKKPIVHVSDAELWQLRTAARKAPIESVRERLCRQLEASGASPVEAEGAKPIFDVIKGLIIMATSPSPTPSFPGLTGESRKTLDARLGHAGMTVKQEWNYRVCQFNNETLNSALMIGLARRFATYKRPNLLLRGPERLVRLLMSPQRPMQLIIAGKAHPADLAGQGMIREWTHYPHASRERVGHAPGRGREYPR